MPEHRKKDVPAGEGIHGPAHPLGAVERVVLVSAFGEARGGVHVVVGAEGDDEEIGVVGAGVGGDPTAGPVYARDRLLPELDALLGDVAVVQPHRVGLRSDSRVASSRPPKPAPRITTCGARTPPQVNVPSRDTTPATRSALSGSASSTQSATT